MTRDCIELRQLIGVLVFAEPRRIESRQLFGVIGPLMFAESENSIIGVVDRLVFAESE